MLGFELDRDLGAVTITINGPDSAPPARIQALQQQGAVFWSLALARELDVDYSKGVAISSSVWVDHETSVEPVNRK